MLKFGDQMVAELAGLMARHATSIIFDGLFMSQSHNFDEGMLNFDEGMYISNVYVVE